MSEKPFTATIVVATHKKFRMPKDPLYLPIHVGAEGKRDAKGNPLDFGYQKDNEGDNISIKNPRYCELTGIYWAWKHLDSDYIGLVHYRRYFGGRNKGKDLFDSILTGKELEPMLGKYEVFVPKPQRYMIETLYSHYAHTHYAEHLDATRAILSERYPEYLQSYDKIMDQTHINNFIDIYLWILYPKNMSRNKSDFHQPLHNNTHLYPEYFVDYNQCDLLCSS